ncbi:hypothetical protein VTO42DRAFT_5242 [Malbranchea cinnamomea]
MRLPSFYGRQLDWALGRRSLPAVAACCPRRPGVPPTHIAAFRGARTKSAAKLKELAQGALKAKEPYSPLVNDAPQYSTVIQGARNNMLKFRNCVLLTRVGNFYELYFEQAEEYAALLNIKLAAKKTAAGPVPMAGFPYFHLDRYLKILVMDLRKYVAISEEFVNDSVEKVKSGGLMFDRKVSRIVTPGTLIDEKFMDPSENNFLLAVHIDGKQPIPVPSGTDELPPGQFRNFSESQVVGLSWLDLSTGDFFTQHTSPQMLPSAIARIGAREIVIDHEVDDAVKHEMRALIGDDHKVLTFFRRTNKTKSVSEWDAYFESSISDDIASSFTAEEVAACNMLLEYVQVQTQGMEMKLQSPRRRHLDESMAIDRNSLKGLEILETAREGLGKGSLFHAVRRTSTKSGARLLRDRLTSPSASLHTINERLDIVSGFLHDQGMRETTIQFLKRSYDAQRLVQKFSLGRGDAEDLLCLSRAIQAARDIKAFLLEKVGSQDAENLQNGRQGPYNSLRTLINRLNLDGPEDLSQQILQAIDEEGLMQRQLIEDEEAADAAALAQEVIMNEGSPEDLETFPKKLKDKTHGKLKHPSEPDSDDEPNAWIMRRDASPDLLKLHEALNALKEEKRRLTEQLRDAADGANLTLKWTPGLGHIVHIKGQKAMQQSLERLGVTRTVSSSKSTRSFYHPLWSRLGARIDDAKLQIRAEEQRIFKSLRQGVILNLVKLRRNAAVLDELDVACSFATLAQEQNWVRPIVNNGISHKIVGGRHPTVKIGLEEQGRPFVSNDCFLGNEERVWLITGPNMGGKSTFLRQNALITILAQAGSFVPADHAEIGIVDQIFSRIGAADDLFRDQSTFMVEMLETAAILKHATPRSFVIMDEVGRGTTPEDGTAVAYACLHHLYNVNKSRTLFATHFHSLADRTAQFEHLGRYCTDVKESPSGAFSFVHKLKPGVNRQSHALKVARLAGVPESAIQVARDVLNENSATNHSST